MTGSTRMDEVYRRREALHPPGYYSLFQPGHLYLVQRREEIYLRALRRHGFFPLAGRSVLDLGCGSGEGMVRHLLYGSGRADLVGLEIQPRRLAEMRSRFPGLMGVQADAAALPFGTHAFDLVHQATMMTLILDPEVRRRVAAEMLRVLKPSGAILWFDFRYTNPANVDARGIGAAQIRSLFPGCSVELRSLSLLPPLARRLAGVAPTACRVLEWLPPLRTHYLAVIRPRG